jgi:hypothetical protein
MENKKMNTQEFFEKNGYALVKNAITPELRDFVTQYALFDEMQKFNGIGDSQIPNAHYSYADPSMETMLLHLLPTMEENTGLKLFPTYSYYRVYKNNSELKTHKDRPSCEISATLCFNYSYDDSKFTWPIFMEGNGVNLKPGDMVIYRGCDLNHWRNPMISDDEHAWHVQGFFHYVNQNGPYSDYKHDKRESIGLKKNNDIKGTLNKSYIKYV